MLECRNCHLVPDMNGTAPNVNTWVWVKERGRLVIICPDCFQMLLMKAKKEGRG